MSLSTAFYLSASWNLLHSSLEAVDAWLPHLSLNVLDVQRNLFDAQLELAEGESFTFLSLINLYKALGGGWVTEADAEALEAEANS